MSVSHDKGNTHTHTITYLIYFSEEPAFSWKGPISPVSPCVQNKKLIRQHSGDPQTNKQAGEVRSWPQLSH